MTMTKNKIQNLSFSHRVSVVHGQYHQKYYYNFVSQGLQSKMYIISLQLPPDPQLRFLYYTTAAMAGWAREELKLSAHH